MARARNGNDGVARRDADLVLGVLVFLVVLVVARRRGPVERAGRDLAPHARALATAQARQDHAGARPARQPFQGERGVA